MGRAAAAGRLLSAHERDGCGQAARRLGRESAGLWAARGKNGGRPTGPRQQSSWAMSRPAGPGEGARGGREKRGGRARWAAGGECRPMGERGEREGKKKGSFSHFNHFSKSRISQIQSTQKICRDRHGATIQIKYS
jgi:hypothetical protein